MKTYKELIVWQKSIDLVEEVYRATRNFPEDEKFNLVSQIRRSFASSSELETQLLIAFRLKMISKKEYDMVTDLLTYVRKMLSSLISKTTNN